MFGSSLGRCFKMGLQTEGEKGWKQEILRISQVLFSLENIPIFLLILENQTTIFTIFHFHSF